MEPKVNTDYKTVLSDVIKKQMIVLGPDITLAKVREITGIVISQDGTVTEITQAPTDPIPPMPSEPLAMPKVTEPTTPPDPLATSTPDLTAPKDVPAMPDMQKTIDELKTPTTS